MFVGYWLLAQLSYLFVIPTLGSAVFWLPSGLTVAWFLSTEKTRWPIWLAVIFVVETLVIRSRGLPLPVALWWGAANCVLPLVGALLVLRTATPFELRRVRDVVALVVLGGVIAALPGALVASAAGAHYLNLPSFAAMVIAWWASDAVGVVLLAPLLLVAIDPGLRKPAHAGSAAWERVLAGIALAIATWMVFAHDAEAGYVLPYLPLPFAAWVAMRFGVRDATLATVAMDLIAVYHTMRGRGPFAGAGQSPTSSLLNTQLYVAIASSFGLLLATATLQQASARAEVERAAERTRFLSDATRLLGLSLDYRETLDRLAGLVVASLGDWCVIDLVEGGEIRRVAGAHADPRKRELVGKLRERSTPQWSSMQPSAVVLRTRKHLLLPELTEAAIRAHALDSENARLIRELGTRTVIAVPLVVRESVIGVLTVASATPGVRYGEADVVLVEALADRAAFAIDNARHYGEAREAIRLRDEFLSIASHELNTPVASLSLTVRALSRAGLAEPLAAKVSSLARQSRRLSSLIDELLNVSRIRSGRIDLVLEDCDLREVASEVCARLAEDAARANCTISVAGDAAVRGHWDRHRLDQVVTNLLSNAIKFARGTPVEVTVETTDGWARLTVADRGAGIPEERLPYVFDRFERAVSARTHGGLGLGLYIVRTICEALGGRARAENAEGGGAVLTVELPRRGPSEASAL